MSHSEHKSSYDPKEAALKTQLYACQKALRFVRHMLDNWRELGGRRVYPNSDVLIAAIFARSTRTYEAVVKQLGNAGFGEQGLMLSRSLFEDMLDAHWVSLNPDTAIDRVKQHDEWSTHLRLGVRDAFPEYFDAERPAVPELPPATRSEYAGLFGKWGEKSWTGLSIYARVNEVEPCWQLPHAKRQFRFIYAWVHKLNNETLHLSGYSLGRTPAAPHEESDAWRFSVGSTPTMLTQALFSAFWAYWQTLTLVFDTFELGLHDRFAEEVGDIAMREFRGQLPVEPAELHTDTEPRDGSPA